MSLVAYEVRDHVAVIRLCDEKRRNALSAALVDEVLTGLSTSRADGARAVVISAAGRCFSAGADLTADPLRPASPTPPDLFRALQQENRPVIAAVDGLALGGGFELVLSCHLAIVSAEAVFALPEVGVGVVPNTAMSLLPPIVGTRRALDIILTRRRLDATESLALGIATAVVDAGTAEQAAGALARSVVDAGAPAAVAVALRSLTQRGDAAWGDMAAAVDALDPAEIAEGFAAFRERRAPDFTSFWSGVTEPVGGART